MRVEDLLDFPRKEFLAAAVDDLLAASGQLDVARLVDVAAEIAGPEPAIRREGLLVGARIVVISEVNGRPTRGDLADFPMGNVIASRVHA